MKYEMSSHHECFLYFYDSERISISHSYSDSDYSSSTINILNEHDMKFFMRYGRIHVECHAGYIYLNPEFDYVTIKDENYAYVDVTDFDVEKLINFCKTNFSYYGL